MSPAPADLARRASVIRATSAPARRRAPNRHPEAAEQKARTRYCGSDHELVEALLWWERAPEQGRAPLAALNSINAALRERGHGPILDQSDRALERA